MGAMKNTILELLKAMNAWRITGLFNGDSESLEFLRLLIDLHWLNVEKVKLETK